MAVPTRHPTPRLNQNELRRFMKEKQNLKGGKKKIESPLAKYNNLDQLFCILCNSQIKNELLWPAHISGKVHKENLEALKTRKQEAEDSSKFKQPLPPPPPKPLQSILKRKSNPQSNNASASQDKRLKGNAHDTSTLGSTNLESVLEEPISDSLAAPSSSLLTLCEQDENNMDTSEAPPGNTNSELPPDFFDETNAEGVVNEDNEVENRLNTVEALPEGFFDDPIVDAKVRKVEYKDPVEEEWDKFQREIADATTKAQAIIDEEEEESTAERQIDEIDEQIRNWERVDSLQRRKEELDVQHKDANAKCTDNDDGTADEQDFDEFLDWRAKDSWR